MIPGELLSRLDIVDATSSELNSGNRLMPNRWDYRALAADSELVGRLLTTAIRREDFGGPAGTILVDKGWRGTRPINELALVDRVAYRAIVSSIAESLPDYLRSREPIGDFQQAPIGVEGALYVSKTDVASYYEFVDHELLERELIAQTADEPAIAVLFKLLRGIMGRRVGIPQVHKCSDILGDVYIDPVRRRMLRAGYQTFSYSDDFRISSPSLGEARKSLERCAEEVRRLGLVLNERKTYTYSVEKYENSIGSFARAERQLFEGDGGLSLLDLDSGHYQDEILDDAEMRLSDIPVVGELDSDEAINDSDDSNSGVDDDIDSPQANAARRAWQLWIEEEETEDAQAAADAAITQILVERSLQRLGMIGDEGPLVNLSLLLRYEPALTPQISSYLRHFAMHGSGNRVKVRDALDEITSEGVLSTWQSLWIAETAGAIRKSNRRRAHYDWLEQCIESPHSGLAATAAAAVSRIGIGDAARIAEATERIASEWKPLAVWALARIDNDFALATCDSELERHLVKAARE